MDLEASGGSSTSDHGTGRPDTQPRGNDRPFRGRCPDCATRGVCLIGSLPQASAGIGPAVRERTFHQGDMLSREGDLSSHFKIIKIGMVFLCRSTAAGAPRPVAVSGRGTAFGIFGFMAHPNQVSVVAASAGRYCEIATERIQSLSGNDRTFRRRLEKLYVDTVAIFARWAEAMGRGSVSARVAAALLLLTDSQRSTSITIPSHSALAELLGTTRESVARALATLEADGGVIRKSPRRCEVFPEMLRDRLAAAK